MGDSLGSQARNIFLFNAFFLVVTFTCQRCKIELNPSFYSHTSDVDDTLTRIHRTGIVAYISLMFMLNVGKLYHNMDPTCMIVMV